MTNRKSRALSYRVGRLQELFIGKMQIRNFLNYLPKSFWTLPRLAGFVVAGLTLSVLSVSIFAKGMPLFSGEGGAFAFILLYPFIILGALFTGLVFKCLGLDVNTHA